MQLNYLEKIFNEQNIEKLMGLPNKKIVQKSEP